MHLKLTGKPLFGKLACGNYESACHLGSKGGREILEYDPLGPKTPRRVWIYLAILNNELRKE